MQAYILTLGVNVFKKQVTYVIPKMSKLSKIKHWFEIFLFVNYLFMLWDKERLETYPT